MKKIFSLVLVVVMICSTFTGLQVTSHALASSGQCGNNAYWSYNSSTGTLTVSGSGPMYNYQTDEYDYDSPLAHTNIKKIVISSGITTIGSYAFCWCKSLTSVTFPDSLKDIYFYSFSDCSSLKELIIPDSVQNIGDRAFEGCSALSKLTILGTCYLYDFAFEGCSGIKELTISASLGFGLSNHYTFFGCENIERITILSVNGSGAIEDFSTNSDPSERTEVYYKYTPWYISRNKLKTLIIEDGVTSIGRNSFYGCSSLINITIPDSITSIHKSSFLGTAYYENTDNWENGVLYLGKTVIGARSNETVGGVEIKKGTKCIGGYSFQNCENMTSITIPNSVNCIGDYAFAGCKGLNGIEIPVSVTSIGENAFKNCTYVVYSGSATGAPWNAKYYGMAKDEYFLYGNLQKTVLNKCISNNNKLIIPDTVTKIASFAFYDCKTLTNITIPDTVISIDNAAFWGCSGLKELTMPASAVIFNSANTFNDCTNIEKVTLTKGTGTMQNYSLLNDTSKTSFKYTPWYFSRNNLKELVIKEGIKNIGDYAFDSCSQLTSINIPDSVTSIGRDAFYGCSGLTKIVIPNSVKQIGICAFEYCSGLTSVVLGNSIASISNSMFRECSNLTSVTLPVAITGIGDSAFMNCFELSSITLSNNIKSIGKDAFKNCFKINLSIPNSLTSVGESAFYKCIRLQNVIIPNSVTGIGKSTFCECTSLKKVTIGNSVETVDEYAFHNCANLTSVIIPVSVTSIGKNAFSFCSKLADIYYFGTQEQWSHINVEESNECLLKATIHFNYIEHIHSYTAVVTTKATCTQAGVKTFICNCGESYTSVIPATGHSFVNNKEYCQNGCGTRNPNYVAPHTHHYQETVIYPDSIHLGYIEHTCSCGDCFFDSYIAPTGKLTLKHSARTANALKVTWNNVKTATGYQVQVSTKDGKKWDKYYNLKSGVTFYTFKNLAAGNAYKYRVRFYIAKNGKNYYSPWSSTLTSPTLPTGTTLTKLTPAKKAFTAQWKKNATVTGYKVQYSLKSNFSGAKTITVKSPKTLKAVAKKLNAGKYYYVRIRTYKTISKVNYFSAWSKTYKVKTK